ncbi:MAG: response regulator, partial [Treponema sp.]|nr:response regulator [Treponema sp.]
MRFKVSVHYKLILVEDEPGAAENIRDMIRLYCPRFELAGSAGRGGLELIRRSRPDLLLTDMSRIDGLELLKQFRRELPDLAVIIVSPYRDFEYARTAMRQGAADCILKPVDPADLRAALERIIPLLDRQRGRNRLSIIQRLLNNSVVEEGELEKYFTAPAYTAAISRKNGLPSRFSGGVYNPKYSVEGETLDLYGRDEMESIHICPDNSARSREAFDRINWLHAGVPGYTTAVVCADPFPIEKLPGTIKSLYRILDGSLTIGLNQVISAALPEFRQGRKTGETDAETFKVLNHYIKESKFDKIRGFFPEFLEKCRQERRPQLYVEKSIRILFERLRFQLNNTAFDDEFEFMIDDAFFYAATYDELTESFQDILDRLLLNRARHINKIDTPEFFESVKEYISLHLAEPLSLQSMCGHFGISQTYISRLFRKYSGQSFINYLRKARIEKAKRYLANRDIP